MEKKDSEAAMRPHLTEEEIALLVEGSFNDSDKRDAYEHMSCCPHCFGDFKDAAIGHGIWTTERDFYVEHPELVSAGLKFAGEGIVPSDRSKRDSVRSSPRFRKPRWLAVAACAALLIAAAVWLPGRIHRRTAIPDGDSESVQAVHAVAVLASSRLEIVLPGTEDSFNPDLPNYRAGIEYDSHLLYSPLTELAERCKESPAGRDDLFWLATGFLATGKLSSAKDYIDIARAQYPDDEELAVLDALVLYFEGNSAKAEQLLREVHRTNSGYAVAQFNLCVVLLEREKTKEAKTLLEDLQKLHPNTRLAMRAGKLLAQY